MANALRIRKGLKAALPTLAVGEPGFTTDTKELFIGASGGNVQIGGSIGGAVAEIAEFAAYKGQYTITAVNPDGSITETARDTATGTVLATLVTSRSANGDIIETLTIPGKGTTTKITKRQVDGSMREDVQ